MHITQKRLLDLAQRIDLGPLSLRTIGEKIGEKHAQNIKHHMQKLFDLGFLTRSVDGRSILVNSNKQASQDLFISLPIRGIADCGPATKFADDDIIGYLTISKSIIGNMDKKDLFVLKAVGNSMNKAKVNNEKNIEEGDYVVINTKTKQSLNNKYILSIIGNMANIKKLQVDNDNHQIVLLSESTEEYPPIYIHESDFCDFFVNGEVIQVIKRPISNT